LPAKYLKFAPEKNRFVRFNRWGSTNLRIRVSTYAGALDSLQRIYLRLEATRTGGAKVLVYQAEQAIGIIPWPEMYRVRDWLTACFDGGLYILDEYQWDEEGLVFELYLPPQSAIKSGPDVFELLPVIQPEASKKFLFSQPPSGLLPRDSHWQPGEILYCPLNLRRLSNEKISILFENVWSLPAELTKEMRERIGVREEVLIYSHLALSRASSLTELEVLDSFRAPSFDDAALYELQDWKPTAEWIHAESDFEDL